MQQSMMFDTTAFPLCGTGLACQHIQLPDAQLSIYPNFYSQIEADQLFDALRHSTPWRHESIRIAGIDRMQPRLTAWYGDPNASYRYSGLQLTPLNWTPTLTTIRERLGRECQVQSNSVLLNFYRNEQDSMGWHSDDEKELGRDPVIASLTLGASRDFLLKHKTQKQQRYKLPLPHGSLLIMAGSMQDNWLHAIAKEKLSTGERINLTFRQIKPIR